MGRKVSTYDWKYYNVGDTSRLWAVTYAYLTQRATIKKITQSNILKNTVINKSMQNFRKMFKQLTDREEKKNKTNEKQEQTENKKWQS